MRYYVVDAFAEKVFEGNPAGVCVMEQWIPDGTMQDIAMENNLSETAFAVREKGGYRLRWFTPGGKNISDGGIAPDKSVGLSSDDANHGHDPQAEAARKLIAG